MERRIQFAQTSDGVSIAFHEQGSGHPLIAVPNLGLGHLLLEASLLPELDGFLNRLGQHFRLVRYDARGGGVSQRDVADRSFDGFEKDIEAIVARLGLERVALFGYQAGSIVSMRFAAHHPDLVSHLVIWPWYRMPDSASQAAMASLVRANWDAFTEMFGALAFRGSPGDVSHRFAALMREAMSQEGFAHQWMSAYIGPDEIEPFYEDLAAHVQCPTLVLQPREQVVDRGLTNLVASLSRGMLQSLQGGGQFPYMEAADECVAAITDFVRPSEDTEHEETVASGLRIVVAMIPEDEAGLRELEALVDQVASRSGAEHVWSEDGCVFSSFLSSQQAIDAALAVRAAWRPAATPPKSALRIGIHAGEPASPDDAHMEATSSISGAVANEATGGRIRVTNLVRELSAGKSHAFTYAGVLKGAATDGPVPLYELAV